MHSKQAAKSSGEKFQWQILESLGISPSEIPKFADADYWLDYFPHLAIPDLQLFGTKIDWRRSFITTKSNPYFDSFIRWQFNKLRQSNRIKFGKRHTIFSKKDGQPCMDHDRQSGEGVGPQEYTAIKLTVLEFKGKLEPLKQFGRVSLLAATLRPETMYGQTNCWVGTEVKYGAFKISADEVFICTERAASNLAHQGFSESFGEWTKILEIMGSELLGLAVSGPLSSYEKIHVLPLMTVSASKGTGIVTSVPSDSADDHAALRDLKEKPLLRQKFGLLDEHVLPFHPISAIYSELYGDFSAAAVCDQLNIKSQNDKIALEKAKELIYKDGFYKGVMNAGEFKGRPTQEAKPLIKAKLIESGDAIVYFEPEKLVISRSGDECVVSLVDQWYLDYGEASWRQDAAKCISRMEFNGPEVRHQFESALDWLQQWACSRSYGLGSTLPWDSSVLIDSLSDSTIYMAYYTVAKFFHSKSLTGMVPDRLVEPENLTDEVWEYIFCEGPLPASSPISSDLLQQMKQQFEYFYPLDMRVSGKDLIPNHLVFMIYNHVSIFPEKYWPRSVRANGHLMLDGSKMSKSTGNFMTMHESCEKFTADATRMALADAGDSLEDANFVPNTANIAILRLFSQLEFFEHVINHPDQYRIDDLITFDDRVFESEMNLCIKMCHEAYAKGHYRDALKYGFYELQNARDYYRDVCHGHGPAHMSHELLKRFIAVQSLLLAPITPHFSEYVYRQLLQKGPLMKATWPEAGKIDQAILAAKSYLISNLKEFRQGLSNDMNPRPKKGQPAVKLEQPTRMEIFIAKDFPLWQREVISVLQTLYSDQNKEFQDDNAILAAMKPFQKTVGKKLMPFVMEIKKRVEEYGPMMFQRDLLFEEMSVLEENLQYLRRSLGNLQIDVKQIECGPEEAGRDGEAGISVDHNAPMPGEPKFKFYRD